ncbi:MAG: hypothetical protein ACRDVL_00100 [Acidimicrobiia bacterium]
MAPTLSRRVESLALLVLVLLVMAAPAAGASCVDPLPIDKALAEAETVFVGTVSDLEHDGRLADFMVEEVWKGEVAARVLVSGGPALSELDAIGPGETIVTSVDRHFEVGVRYLVVPWGVDQGVYMDNSCSVTQVYDSSLDEYRPESAQPPVDDTDTVLTARVALGAVAAASAGGFLIARSRRRRASLGVAS